MLLFHSPTRPCRKNPPNYPQTQDLSQVIDREIRLPTVERLVSGSPLLEREVSSGPLVVSSDALDAVVGVGDDDAVLALGAGLRGVLVELPRDGRVGTIAQRDAGQRGDRGPVGVRALRVDGRAGDG